MRFVSCCHLRRFFQGLRGRTVHISKSLFHVCSFFPIPPLCCFVSLKHIPSPLPIVFEEKQQNQHQQSLLVFCCIQCKYSFSQFESFLFKRMVFGLVSDRSSLLAIQTPHSFLVSVRFVLPESLPTSLAPWRHEHFQR